MKCPLELYEYSQRLLGDQVDTVVDALKGGKVGMSQDGQETMVDAQNRYLKEARSNLLTRKN
jgi:hypothetical protein